MAGQDCEFLEAKVTFMTFLLNMYAFIHKHNPALTVAGPPGCCGVSRNQSDGQSHHPVVEEGGLEGGWGNER